MAARLCFENKNDAGFLVAKSALQQFKDDLHASLFLKECMCFCHVSEEYYDEMFQIADDVVNGTDTSNLMTAVAWYQKSRIAMLKGDYKNALSYSEISLQFLKQESYQKIEGRLCSREYFEYLCHNVRSISFEKIGQFESHLKEVQLMKNIVK